MKVKYSALVSDMRGKLNGSVASKNRAGSYLRNKVTPVNPNTVYQVGVRQSLTSLSQSWRGLTDAQRESWINAVDNFNKTNIFGDSVKLSGIALYNSLNRNLDTIGSTRLTSAPAPGSVPSVSTLSVVADTTGGTMEATFTPAIAATIKIVVMATAPQSAGKNFVKSEFRKIAVLTNADTSPKDLAAAYIAKFGALPAVGQKVFISFKPVVIATGIAGLALQASDIAA